MERDDNLITNVSSRTMRKRKSVNYAKMINKKLSTNSSSNESSDDINESDDIETLVHNEEDVVDEDNEYDLIRKKNREEHEQFLRQLDFSEFKRRFPATSKIAKNKRKFLATPESKNIKQRWSLRLQGKPANDSVTESSYITDVLNIQKPIRNNEENIPMLLDDEEDMSIFRSHDKFEDFPLDFNYSTCSLSDYVKSVAKCRMWKEPTKVLPKRITTLDMACSLSNFILIAGDVSGNLSLWNIETNTGSTFHPHFMQLNCVSFAKNDPMKFYSTSHEGIVRRGDINSRQFEKIYSSSERLHESGSCYHVTTWHDEVENSLYIGIGNGKVAIVDLRTNKVSTTIECHIRSVRTVQHHPVNNNYFVTSSGIGEFGIFDIRNANSKKSTVQITNINKTDSGRSKGLSSAFFSSQTGDSILTTCNDDTIRIYSSKNFKKISESRRIIHNNHTGRWLSVFKARWLSMREDMFYVGSMLLPKRLQLYDDKAQLLHNFGSEYLTTYCPVITVHNSLPLFVAGNASGKIHVFSQQKEFVR